jgi:hypothetical protein
VSPTSEWLTVRVCPYADVYLWVRVKVAYRPDSASAEGAVPGIKIAFRLLSATDERQDHVEHKISEEMRRDIGQEVAKFHIK